MKAKVLKAALVILLMWDVKDRSKFLRLEASEKSLISGNAEKLERCETFEGFEGFDERKIKNLEKSKNFVGYSNAETVKTSEIPRTAEIFKETSGECASSRQASKRDDETVEAWPWIFKRRPFIPWRTIPVRSGDKAINFAGTEAACRVAGYKHRGITWYIGASSDGTTSRPGRSP